MHNNNNIIMLNFFATDLQCRGHMGYNCDWALMGYGAVMLR